MTLIIEVESTTQQNRWREVIISSCHVLHVKDCLDLDVEIFAQDPNSEMRVFAISASHPFIATWPPIRTKIVGLLREYEWETLDLLLYGKTIDDAKPTVFIATKDMSKYDWSKLVP